MASWAVVDVVGNVARGWCRGWSMDVVGDVVSMTWHVNDVVGGRRRRLRRRLGDVACGSRRGWSSTALATLFWRRGTRTASWVVVDGVGDVVWVTWHADGVVGGRQRCLRRRLGDVARGRRRGQLSTAFATSFG